jgi:ATP-dependent helicase HrpA
MGSCMTLCHEHGWKENQKPAGYEAPQGAARRPARQHRPEGRGEDKNYLGARGIRFYIHPGSALRRRPALDVAAELVETSRLFARCAARSSRSGWSRSAAI